MATSDRAMWDRQQVAAGFAAGIQNPISHLPLLVDPEREVLLERLGEPEPVTRV
mgnify:CR=1 FL=1